MHGRGDDRIPYENYRYRGRMVLVKEVQNSFCNTERPYAGRLNYGVSGFRARQTEGRAW